ncbi:MAG: D-glycero-beta-D-manno-heptose 1-phosphate adenylyltransferase [Acidobacteriota bacterium]
MVALPPNQGSGSLARAVVVGDSMVDVVIRGRASRLSSEAPVPIVHQRGEEIAAGGAANVAVNLRALGVEVTLLGLVGGDAAGRDLQRSLEKGGVDGSCLLESKGRPTTMKTRLVAQRQQIARVDREVTDPPSAGEQRRLEQQVAKVVPGCQVVLVADYGKGVITADLWERLVQACRSAGTPLLVDPRPQTPMETYRGATLIKPNWAEACQATQHQGHGERALDEVGRQVLACSQAECAVITRGDRGLSLFRPRRPRLDVPSRRRDVYDVTGAGDTVLATLGWARAVGLSVEEAAWLANLAGGLAVERFGAACISRQDLERALYPDSGLEEKRVSREDLTGLLERKRREGRQIVFTNGCFDLLHAGHLRLLRHCAACGDFVVVGLNSDASIRRLKGASRPILPETERSLVLAALREVDAVVVFEEDTPEQIIREVLPDVLVKGGDYSPEAVVGRDIVEGHGGRLEIVPLRDGASTSEIINKIRAGAPPKTRSGKRSTARP